MPPIGTAAPGNAALLVARILQPLARSLEDARRHLNLETVASDEAADDTAPAPAPAPPYFAAPGTRRAFDRIAAREGDTALVTPPAVHPDAPETWPDMASASTPQTGTAAPARAPGAPPAPRFMRVVTENRLTPSRHDNTAASDADASTTRPGPAPASRPAFFARHATRSAAAAGANSGTPNSPPPEIAAAGVATGKPPPASLPPQLRVLATPAQAAPHLPGDETGPAATPLTRPTPTTPTTPHLAPVPPQQASAIAPDANPPGPASAAARQPLQAAATPTAPRHWRLRPAAHADLTTPATRTAHGDPARPAAFESANETPRQSPSAAPSQLPRNPALTRVLQAMDPVLDKAWQLTDAALSPDQTSAPTSPDAPRVNNNFNVTVALGDASSAAGRDPQQLQDALVALLRDAARRQGLDV